MTTQQRQKCEIWTRVMGYHRPVSQYNHGKKSEFYSRNYFTEQALENSEFINKYQEKKSMQNLTYILFTTTTCPKCPAMKDYVSQELNFSGEMIDNTNQEFLGLAQKHQVNQAPTIIFFNNDKEVFRANEILEIEEFLKC